MLIPQYAYIKYLIMTTCEIPQAREQIINYLDNLYKNDTKCIKNIKNIPKM